MLLLSLPTETQCQIVAELALSDSYEGRTSLAALRLCCRPLNDMATRHFFTAIPLWLSLSSIINLTSLAANESLSV